MNGLMRLLAEKLPPDERLLVVSMPGDPDEADGRDWNGRPWSLTSNWKLRADWNNYLSVCSAKRDAQGRYRRVAASFGRALVWMVDDVGTKVDASVLGGLEPTMRVLTSPENEQWWFVLREPLMDAALFGRFSSAFIAQRLGGKDPGMAGFNRIGRIAPGINGKRRYGGAFEVQELSFRPQQQYSLEELAEGVKVVVPEEVVRKEVVAVEGTTRAARIAEFNELRETMRAMGMLRREHANVSGRIPILCPWFQLHTMQAKTGTYLVEPNERNRWAGSFVCFHGGTHNNDNHLSQIRNWVEDVVEKGQRAAIAAINAGDFQFEDLKNAE